jgi:transcriptional regulator with XRE-family HTH domain
LRTRVGFSQEELAQLVGSSQAEISRMERGCSQLIRPRLLVRLASVLGVSPAALLPDVPSQPAVTRTDVRPSEVLRVGFWESVWTAPLIALSEQPPPSVFLSSRVRVGSLYKIINPDVQRDPRNRPLTPDELVRALDSSYFAAIVAPREILLDHADELTECAQVAIAIDGVHAAICMSLDDAAAVGFDGQARSGDVAPWSAAAWHKVRAASMSSPIRIYFPFDVGAVETVRRIREILDGRVELCGVAPEHWPAFWSDVDGALAPGGPPVIAVAAEPLLDGWRRGVWDSNRGLTTVPVHCRASLPEVHPTVSVLSLFFNRARCAAWLTRPIVYEFLDAVERQAQEIHRRSPRVVAAIAERLQLDQQAVLRECANCDFTTRYTPSWVAQLRGGTALRAG